MSQRLHIGSTKEDFYDCVLTSTNGAEKKLREDWLAMGNGIFLGPWKIRIGDKNLFKKIEPTITGIFAEIGQKYPDDVWLFYDGERNLEHPTREELDAWLSPAVDHPRLVRLVRLDPHWKANRRANGKPWRPIFWEYLPKKPAVTGRDSWPAIPWSVTIWLWEKYAIIIQPNDKLSRL